MALNALVPWHWARKLVFLIVLVPLVPIALAIWAWALPRVAQETSIRLTGQWRALATAEPLVGLELDDSSWGSIKLPGSFVQQGLSGPEVVLRRTFVLTEPLRGEDLLFVLGHVRGASVRVFVNGALVGLRGEYTSGFHGAESGSDSYLIPGRLMKDGTNLIALQVNSVSEARNGIIDARMLLGRHDALKPWVFREGSIRMMLELGGVLLLFFLGALLIVLWRLQGSKVDRRLYASALLMVAGALGYLLTKSGVVVSSLVSSALLLKLVTLFTHTLGIAFPEFFEAYFLKRTTAFARFGRFFNAVAWPVMFAEFFGLFPLAGQLEFRLYVVWMLLTALHGIGLSVWSLARRPTVAGSSMALVIWVTAAVGINDLLADLDIIYSPRLFTLAVMETAVVAAAVLVGEFLKIAQENLRLTVSLEERNEVLGQTLVRVEESARVKSEFLANTSHELRTPLNAIINIPQGLLEQMHEAPMARCTRCQARFAVEAHESLEPRRQCPGCHAQGVLEMEPVKPGELDPEMTARLLRSVVGSGKHLLSVVNDILDYSKLEAGHVTVVAEEFDVGEWLAELQLTMEPVATRAKVKLVIDRPATPLMLEADRVKLTQVMINLLGNAIKFSDGRGTVIVTAEVTGSGAEARLLLSVKDEGIGISPENHARIFEGFRQVDGSQTRRFGGTGLGLAISKRLVEAHGGAIRLESQKGRGSTFMVELPLGAGALDATAADLTSQACVEDEERVVLVVDDELAALDATSVVLSPLKCHLVGVRDPREALERMRELKPQLVVLDVMMPRVSGLELLRSMRSDPALAQVPVLVSSAYHGNKEAVEALGAVFVAKPWRPGELLRLARSLLARSGIHKVSS